LRKRAEEESKTPRLLDSEEGSEDIRQAICDPEPGQDLMHDVSAEVKVIHYPGGENR
jgi:hypothetical protein